MAFSRAQDNSSSHVPLSVSEVISALSFALDLTEGAVPGHAVRSCLLGMRIARQLGVPDGQMSNLYYALLLKDVGCSSNAARMCQIIGGDDRAVKAGVKLEDWTKPHKPKLSTLRLLWTNVLPEATQAQRFGRLLKIGLTQHRNNQEMISLRCERGANIVRKIGLDQHSAEAVRSLDEHWDGSGYPERLRGDQIPMLARILAVAQHLDVFSSERSPLVAIETLRERSGRWFDPEVVRAAISLDKAGALWTYALASDGEDQIRRVVLDFDPGWVENLSETTIDQICEAFAEVVDAKSPFTYRHSLGVANAARRIAEEMGLPRERIQVVHRAALLHDLGKLGVSNSILDKPGKLSSDEWRAIQQHPKLSQQILEGVGAFQEIAAIAGSHHEKLDGTGYPNKLVASQLSLEDRIVAVADVYGALTEDRPYRAGLELDEVVSIMGREVPHKLDPDCLDALISSVSCTTVSEVCQPVISVAAARDLERVAF